MTRAIVTDERTDRSYEIAIETIDPELAAKYLATSAGNRKTRKTQVAKYGRDMEENAWRVNGQAVIFRDDGSLATGHHRLRSSITSGASFTTFVIRGIDALSARTLDTGQSWTTADHLQADGYVNTRSLQAIVRVHLAYQRTGAYTGGSQSAASVEEVYTALEGPEGAELQASSLFFGGWHRNVPFRVTGGIFGALWIQFMRKDPAACTDFFAKLKTGANLAVGDPELALRQRLMTAAHKREQIPEWDMGFYVISAWNYKRRGEALKLSKVTPLKGGEWPEIA